MWKTYYHYYNILPTLADYQDRETMGYRIRLGKKPKTVKAKYAGKTEEELDGRYGENDGENKYFSAAYPPEHTELYEIGKHVDYNQHTESFYDFKLEDQEFLIMTKEGLANIINEYHKSIFEYYSKLDKDNFENHIRSKVNEWDVEKPFGLKPYRLEEPDDCDGFITGSWKIEYAIFNLVYIYRTFDWDNDYLIYSGW